MSLFVQEIEKNILLYNKINLLYERKRWRMLSEDFLNSIVSSFPRSDINTRINI